MCHLGFSCLGEKEMDLFTNVAIKINAKYYTFQAID